MSSTCDVASPFLAQLINLVGNQRPGHFVALVPTGACLMTHRMARTLPMSAFATDDAHLVK